jgi:hypothetical protein
MLVFRIPSDPKSKDAGQPLLYPVNRRYLIPDLRMLKPSSLNPRPPVPVCLLLPFLFLAFAASPLAFGQPYDFTMMVTSPYPSAVDPGQDSRSYINLSPLNGFNGSVSLTCVVTPAMANGPTCTPPPTATPPQQVAMSISTSTATSVAPAGFYALTVTGTSPNPPPPITVYLTVLSATSDYSIAVTTPIFPTSVHAGFTATATVTVSPINGYTGTVTLSCASITPLATPAPSCAFVPPAVSPAPSGIQPPYTSLLTITTTGPTTPPPATASLPGSLNRLGFLWLTFPGLGLMVAGLATADRRRRKLWALSMLWLAAAALFLLPACSTTPTNTGLNGNTPKNSYVFTLTGADTSGVAPSNEATPPMVSLTVD